MRNQILTCAITCILVSCAEQKVSVSELPKPIVKSFGLAYPEITDAEWYKDKHKGKTIYASAWKKDGKRSKAEFDEKGNFLREQ
jgi:hypothetical protein